MRNRGITAKADLIPMFKEAHALLAKYFYSGAGMKAANQDARIALEVIEHFISDEIPILAIHDSFIVKLQYMDRLRETMIQAYRHQTGGFECPVK